MQVLYYVTAVFFIFIFLKSTGVTLVMQNHLAPHRLHLLLLAVRLAFFCGLLGC